MSLASKYNYHVRRTIPLREHFLVHFHDGTRRTAEEAIHIAEFVYQPITSMYNFKPNNLKAKIPSCNARTQFWNSDNLYNDLMHP